mgnify:CR=1 FL=1
MDFIKKLTELDDTWFQEKKKFFKMEPHYDSKNDFIFVNWGTYETEFNDENTGETHKIEEYVDQHHVYNITFFAYCWNSHFDGSLASNNLDYDEDGPIEIHKLPADVEPIKDQILAYLEDLFKDVTQVEVKVNALSKIYQEIKHSLNLDKSSNEYSSLKRQLLRWIQRAIYKRYKNLADLKKLIGKPEQISKDESTVKTKKTYFQSFEYINAGTKPECIKDVMEALKSTSLISDSTTLPAFRKVFTNKEITEKIVWTGRISELAHFIKFIHNKNKAVKNTSKKHWEIASQCFVLEGNISVTAQQLHDAKKPLKTFQRIEGIASNFE